MLTIILMEGMIMFNSICGHKLLPLPLGTKLSIFRPIFVKA